MSSFRPLVAIVAVLLFSTAVHAGSGFHGTAPKETVSPAEQGLWFLKTLKGRWVGTMGEGEDAQPAELIYSVTAGGSSVMVREFPGSEHEMITMYHLDGDKLMMTHYCAMGNQPTMKASEVGDNRLLFDFVRGSNMDAEADGYMGRAEITLQPDGTLHEAWTFFSGRKPGASHVIVASRAD